MRTLLVATLVSGSLVGGALAQEATSPEDEMLIDGTPPQSGVEVPSAPTEADADITGVEIGTGDTEETAGTAPATADWSGLPVVDANGNAVGTIDDVMASGETVILQRADGGVETAPAEAFTYAGGELVVDTSMLN